MKTAIRNITAILILSGTTLFFTSCASTGGSGQSAGASLGGRGAKPYPLKTCIVTDNDLGSMGDEQRIVHQGQEIKFCCKPCVDKFQKNPERYLKKLS